MRMDEGLDTGPIVAQAGTPVAPDETAPELEARLAAMGADLLDVIAGAVARAAISASMPSPSSA